MLKKFLIGTFALALMLSASVAFASYDFGPSTLKVGSKGEYVKTLQTLVGATPADGVFGPMTAAKVKVWQAANGLTADGMFGKMSMAKANAGSTGTTCPAGQFDPMTGKACGTTTTYPAGCTSAMGYSTTTGVKCDSSTTGGTTGGVLGGSEGEINEVKEVSSKDSKLQEGKTNELFAFTAEIDGDVSVDRVDFYLDSTDAGSQSDNADDYFKSASLSVNGTKVATVDVEDFTEDTYNVVGSVVGDSKEFRIRFSGLNSVFTDGAKPKFTLSFEALSSIDGTDLTETWGVELESDSIRFVDGKGFSETAGAALEETFSTETEDVASLSVNSSSNDPDLTTFEVATDEETEDVVVFKFNIEEENDVDVTVEDLTITILTTGTTDESAVVTSADLYKGSTLLGSENVPDGGVVAFTDLGLDISAGDEEELTLKLSFADLLVEGTTVKATFTSIDDAMDENGNDEGDMGTPSGLGLVSETHILRSTGISVDVKTATSSVTVVDGVVGSAPDNATFTWTFDVTAFGDNNVYVNSEIANILELASATSEVDTLYSIGSSVASTLTSLSGTLVESDSDVSEVTAHTDWTNISTDKFFKINKGTTGTFTLTVTGTNLTAAKQVRGLLENIEWTTSDVTLSSATALPINSYTANLGADAATPFVYVN